MSKWKKTVMENVAPKYGDEAAEYWFKSLIVYVLGMLGTGTFGILFLIDRNVLTRSLMFGWASLVVVVGSLFVFKSRKFASITLGMKIGFWQKLHLPNQKRTKPGVRKKA